MGRKTYYVLALVGLLLWYLIFNVIYITPSNSLLLLFLWILPFSVMKIKNPKIKFDWISLSSLFMLTFLIGGFILIAVTEAPMEGNVVLFILQLIGYSYVVYKTSWKGEKLSRGEFLAFLMLVGLFIFQLILPFL